MNYRKAYKLTNTLVIAGVVVLFGLYLFQEINWGFYLVGGSAVLLMAAGLIVCALYYRCPHCCGRLPGRGFGIPDYCPHCGKKLG